MHNVRVDLQVSILKKLCPCISFHIFCMSARGSIISLHIPAYLPTCPSYLRGSLTSVNIPSICTYPIWRPNITKYPEALNPTPQTRKRQKPSNPKIPEMLKPPNLNPETPNLKSYTLNSKHKGLNHPRRRLCGPGSSSKAPTRLRGDMAP